MPARSVEQEKALALRQELALGSGYVDVFDVLRRLGIEVYRRPVPGDGLEGSLTIKDGVAFIFVNSAGSLTRQRLTAAHELGHYELGGRHAGTEVLEDANAVADDHEEYAAFRFARHFLMDSQGVSQLVAGMMDPEERVAAVAHAYVVSPIVAAIHLAELGHIPHRLKDRLRGDFGPGGRLKPKPFLERHGYRMDDMSEPVTELDPGHLRRAMKAYEHGRLSLVAFAESVMLQPDGARELLADAGIEVAEHDS